MCSPGNLISVGFDIVNGIKTVNDIKENRKNAKYNARIALNNAQESIAQAKNQQQTGIEEARKEKIQGIKNANLQMARLAASGFSLDSKTSMYNLDDTLNGSKANAEEIKNKYNLSAKNYYKNADNYLFQSNNIIKNYNRSLTNNALGALGAVADYWYENQKAEKERWG